MSEIARIDIRFDVRSDAGGRDPDQHSPTLRAYHRLLWRKRLPTGPTFHLEVASRPNYLIFRSPGADFFLASDTIIRTFNDMQKMQPILGQLSERHREAFNTRAYTIGGMTLFPGNRVDGKTTINGARGMHPKIADRFDLTLECIRRFYSGEPSPLTASLSRYRSFFELFRDFEGYVDFFLLQELVNDDRSSVRFLAPFDDFKTSPLPADVASYTAYRARTIAFVRARNDRIAEHVEASI